MSALKVTRHDDRSDFSYQGGGGLLSQLFEKTNFIKADRCNINQLNHNVFEQRQYCFCCVVIFEVLTHRPTDKLVLSWLLLLFYTSFVTILLFFFYAQFHLLLWQRERKTQLVALSSSTLWFMPSSWNDYSQEDKRQHPNKALKKCSVMCLGHMFFQEQMNY